MSVDKQEDGQLPSLLSWQRADELVGVLCMISIVLSISWGVLTRYILAQPAAWSFEVALISFVWMVFFGAAAGVRLGMHAAVDTLVSRLPSKVQRVIEIFNWLLLLVLFSGLSILFIRQAFLTHSIATVALNLPRSVIYMPLAIACAAMFYQHARQHPWMSYKQFSIKEQ